MKKILLIESDGALAQPLAAALSGRGLAVKVVADGQEGIDAARAERPDAIVLSAELPRVSGYAVCNRLKKDDALRAIPLVVTSAGSPETFEQHRKLRTRAEDYLAKPFGVDALLERLAPLLGVAALPATDPSAAAIEEVVSIEVEDELEATLAALDGAARSEEDGALDLLEAVAAPAAPPAPFAAPPPFAAPQPDAAELQSLRARLAAAERERDEARARVAQLEAQVAQYEGRVMKAYERLKGEEALKERTRRALAIALQLLEPRSSPPAGAPAATSGDAPTG